MDPMINLHVLVKNVSDSAYNLPEIGGTALDPDEEIDLMDTELPDGHYTDAGAVLRALNDLTGTVLYQKSHADPVELTYRVVPYPSGD